MTAPNLTPEYLQWLLNGATDGPWHLHDCESYDGRTMTYYQEVWSGNLDVIVAEVFRAHNDGGRGNMRLIALAPDLARRVIELEAESKRLRAELAEARTAKPLSLDDPHVLTATTFAAEAYSRVIGNEHGGPEAASVAMGKAFCTALHDPLDESLDWLRSDPEAGKAAREIERAKPSDTPAQFLWWVGHDGENYRDKFATREDAVKSARDYYGGAYICEALHVPLKLSAFFDVESMLESAELGAGEHCNENGDAIFDLSVEEIDTLSTTIKAAIDAWQTVNRRVFMPYAFTEVRNEEYIKGADE